MASTVTCDHCRQTASQREARNWYRVLQVDGTIPEIFTLAGVPVRTGRYRPFGDYCTTECLTGAITDYVTSDRAAV